MRGYDTTSRVEEHLQSLFPQPAEAPRSPATNTTVRSAIWAEQYGMMKTCLGRAFFQTHPVARLRAARGVNYLREMTPEAFFEEERELRQATDVGRLNGVSI